MATDYAQGDYRVVAKRLLPASQELVEWCAPGPGDVVVDVAAGSGNLARLCRDRGCDVVAVDRSREQLLLGTAEDADGIGWVAGEAEALPLPGGIAAAAFSVFGLIYVEQPAVAVAEMARVCRPGAWIGLTAWQTDGYQQAFSTLLRETLSMQVTHDFLMWGDADGIAAQLAPVADDVEVRTADLADRQASVDAWWRARESSPPMANARSQLDDEAYEELGRRMRALAEEFGEHGEEFVLRDRYLVARAGALSGLVRTQPDQGRGARSGARACRLKWIRLCADARAGADDS